jgi:phosphoribosylformylglycinamidine cyclo-ligase
LLLATPVIGLASSGVHSNGFSLVRKIVETSGLGFEAPAPFFTGHDAGWRLLVPTRLYVRSCLRAIQETGAVNGLAHITGGGFTDNIPRVLPKHLGSGSTLRVFPCCRCSNGWQSGGASPNSNFLRTFNCGIGMVAIVKPDAIERVIEILTEGGESVVLLGEVIPAAGELRVIYNGHLDLTW